MVLVLKCWLFQYAARLDIIGLVSNLLEITNELQTTSDPVKLFKPLPEMIHLYNHAYVALIVPFITLSNVI